MKKLITMLLRHWVKTPLKISLTLLSVALGTGILILSFSAGTIIEDEITSLLNNDGLVLHVANGVWGDDGEIEKERPSQWDYSILDKLVSDSSTITHASVIRVMPIAYVSVNGKSFQIRNSVATGSSYLDIYSLSILSGVKMTKQDVDSGLKKVWISEETANTLFGSAELAIGERIIPPAAKGRGRGDKEATLSQFSVAGVFENPTEVARRAFGIADVVYPITSQLPSTDNISRILDFLSGDLIIKSRDNSIEKVTSEVNQLVENNYGLDINVTVWEGDFDGISTYMDELRQTVSIFSISVRILGIILLLTSSLGIFSIMIVEALGRKREIAIERALGASKLQVIKEFWQWSVMLSLVGSILGIALSVILSSTVLGTLSPILIELTGSLDINTSIKPFAVLSGVALALLCGGFLGVLPSFSATKGDISDILREG